MTKFLGFPLTTLGATAIVLVSVFAATQLYTAPAIAAGSPSSSVPKKKCKKNYVWNRNTKKCVTNCKRSYVWSTKQKECVKKTSELLTDDDLYLQARAYVEDGKYNMALDLLRRVKTQKS